jgi:hypothetical protein
VTAPLWSRLVFRSSRAFSALDVAQQLVRDELFFAFLHPNQRAALTSAAYALNSDYVPGGEIFSGGLFSWEKALLEHPKVPKSGRVLLAAAGGGRELGALIARGYEVYAFEPVAPFLVSARRVVRGSTSTVIAARYEDLIARMAGQRGPLDDCRGKFDFCVLGWGSLSHLTEPHLLVSVLKALRALAPSAPVMASFLTRSAGPEATNGGARMLRRWFRRAVQVAGGGVVPPGLRFLKSAGFLYYFTREELGMLCAQAGYEIDAFNDGDYPHALLLPKAVNGGGS